MKFYNCILAIAILFSSHFCNAQDDAVVVGSGGGFTGAVTAYKITSKGKVFKGNGVTDIEYTACAKIKKSKAKKIIRSVHQQVDAIKSFNHPGNMYTFIAIESKGEQTRLTWGDNKIPAPENLKNLYADIMNSVGSLRYKTIKK
ncbi:hypothetical protein [Pseudochryseolinea flava]|uniref:Uncharacterized protein n=1 Tax=Pseudochryseolinea flava TaxID=2059302 RepID=A0A364Y471_9BACT|nr:hypothetical protein [Pseudochryseolinea flava]RAW00615.1 hypothetical protein DQQ10_13560 [Pseudochryseolinea flava]